MIRHIVMWNVRGNDAEARLQHAEKVRDAFHSLRGAIPGLLALEIGIDHSRELHSCDVVLVSEFESTDALDRYADHPEHMRVRRELEGLRSTRYQVDYEME